MQLVRFCPSLGQRYVVFSEGGPSETEVVTQLIPALTVFEAPSLELRSEQRLSRRKITYVALAAAIAAGTMRPSDAAAAEASTSSVSLQDLVARMSEGQRWAFTDRVAYVLAVEGANVGLSWKSKDFRTTVLATFTARQAAGLKALLSNSKARPVPEKPPSAFSVDRWFRLYRARGRDLRVLAQEVLATHFRRERRPDEKRLLRAFLLARTAEIGVTPSSQLTRDFNLFARSVAPDAIDKTIDDLHQQALRAAERNATIRKAKGSMHKKPRPASKALPADKGVYHARQTPPSGDSHAA